MNPVEQAKVSGLIDIEGRVYRRTQVGALHIVCDLSICDFCKKVNKDKAKDLERGRLESRCPAAAFKDLSRQQSPNICYDDGDIWLIDREEASDESRG